MRSLPEFPSMVDLDFSHQRPIAELLEKKGIQSSDFAFYNLFGWYLDKKPMISRIDDHLVIKLEGPEGKCLFLPPLGLENIRRATRTLLEFFLSQHCPLELSYVPKAVCEELLREFPRIRSEAIPADFDYLYSRKELSELAGRKFHQKKNFVNRILDAEKPVVEVISKGNLEESLSYLKEWYKEFPGDDVTMRLERQAAERLLPNLDKIGGRGILVRIEGKVLGLSVASPTHATSWVVSLEKADKTKKGLYQFINWALVNRLPERVTIVNRETDLGLEGLRTAKLSYHPVGFEEKFRVYFPDSTL